MGLYIETNSARGKYSEILRTWPQAQPWDGEKSYQEIPEGFVAVCVVQNMMFDAAGVAFDEREYNEFQPNSHDRRDRDWLLVRKEDVLKLPRAKQYFNED